MMKLKSAILALVLLDFVAFSGYVMYQVGYLGIWQAGINDWGSLQILVDLIVVCSLAMAWMIADARQRGLNPWPYVVITLFAGSIGPLSYLLWRERRGNVEALAVH